MARKTRTIICALSLAMAQLAVGARTRLLLSATAPARYEDLGLGQCVLAASGAVLRVKKLRAGQEDCEVTCTQSEDCQGYVWDRWEYMSGAGSCVQYLGGPLKLGGSFWGRGHCKVKAEPLLTERAWERMLQEGVREAEVVSEPDVASEASAGAARAFTATVAKDSDVFEGDASKAGVTAGAQYSNVSEAASATSEASESVVPESEDFHLAGVQHFNVAVEDSAASEDSDEDAPEYKIYTPSRSASDVESEQSVEVMSPTSSIVAQEDYIARAPMEDYFARDSAVQRSVVVVPREEEEEEGFVGDRFLHYPWAVREETDALDSEVPSTFYSEDAPFEPDEMLFPVEGAWLSSPPGLATPPEFGTPPSPVFPAPLINNFVFDYPPPPAHEANFPSHDLVTPFSSEPRVRHVEAGPPGLTRESLTSPEESTPPPRHFPGVPSHHRASPFSSVPRHATSDVPPPPQHPAHFPSHRLISPFAANPRVTPPQPIPDPPVDPPVFHLPPTADAADQLDMADATLPPVYPSHTMESEFSAVPRDPPAFHLPPAAHTMFHLPPAAYPADQQVVADATLPRVIPSHTIESEN